MGEHFLKSLELTNFLSFGEEPREIKLEPLNIIIGANGSGKSNFLDAIEFLGNAASDPKKRFGESGVVSDWIWKGGENDDRRSRSAIVKAMFSRNPTIAPNQNRGGNLVYELSFSAENEVFNLVSEALEDERKTNQNAERPFFYLRQDERGQFVSVVDDTAGRKERRLHREDITPNKPILSQKQDSEYYPEIAYLARELKKIGVYREWRFGRRSPAMSAQPTDMQLDTLLPDCSNLAAFLTRIGDDLKTRRRILDELQIFYASVEDYTIRTAFGTSQIGFREYALNRTVPASRLSDGTMRYLCMLAILCDPTPPPLICIEEPELGLHPDVMGSLAKLMVEASERTQIIVVTHSADLVDNFTDNPQAVLVCEKDEEGTMLKRLDNDSLKPWLEEYGSLKEIWESGYVGGKRF